MSYEARSDLIADPTFTGRLNACAANEALAKTGDFADRILAAWGYGAQAFQTLVVSSPGFDKPQDEVTDGDLLSAVQATWDRAEAIATPPATP
jgi:hypothetical protein